MGLSCPRPSLPFTASLMRPSKPESMDVPLPGVVTGTDAADADAAAWASSAGSGFFLQATSGRVKRMASATRLMGVDDSKARRPQNQAICLGRHHPMLSKILVLVALVLLALKYGLRARLRELWLKLDGIINVLLALIIVGYAVQLVIILLTR
jgi:hypothetical protein